MKLFSFNKFIFNFVRSKEWLLAIIYNLFLQWFGLTSKTALVTLLTLSFCSNYL